LDGIPNNIALSLAWAASESSEMGEPSAIGRV
jgi:hypothetical protein